MKLSDFTNALKEKKELNFVLPNGSFVPKHFHITEIGLTSKQFIDCGGVVRNENRIVFQLWFADDFNHRLTSDKLVKIINVAKSKFLFSDEWVEFEYQEETIGRYMLDYDGINFLLVPTLTDCLAKDGCGIPEAKIKLNLSNLGEESVCAPGGSCC